MFARLFLLTTTTAFTTASTMATIKASTTAFTTATITASTKSTITAFTKSAITASITANTTTSKLETGKKFRRRQRDVIEWTDV